MQDVSEFLAEHLNVAPRRRGPRPRDLRRLVPPAPRAEGGRPSRATCCARIPGLELVELAHPERCCGSAGIYNITQAATAEAILDQKMADIAATGAELVIISNTGCHMQLMAGRAPGRSVRPRAARG